MASGAVILDQGIIAFPTSSSDLSRLGPKLTSVPGSKESRSEVNRSNAAADRLRVLVVDDESENTEFVARCLRQSYDVDTASSAEQGLELIRNNRYDLIISDQRMPGMSGSQFLAESLQQTPGSIRIIITAYSDMDAAVDAINKADVSAFVRKPFTPNELRDAINHAGKAKGVVDHRTAKDEGFQQIVESLSVGVAVVVNGKVRYHNPQWCDLVGSPSRSEDFVEVFPFSERTRLAGWVDGDGETPVATTLANGDEVSLSSVSLEYKGERARLVHVHPRSRVSLEAPLRPRILLVDDEEPLVRSFKRLLRSKYEVVTALSGQEAWDILQQDSNFQLVLSDIDMPRMNGINLYKEIAAANPDLASKVVLMTGGAGIEGTDLINKVRCLSKPVTAADVVALMRH